MKAKLQAESFHFGLRGITITTIHFLKRLYMGEFEHGGSNYVFRKRI
ncbi:MAG: hypothetical protein JWQ87_1274 [Candidatus Sulfotelmatobacter sp.]|nr:hypothetical protein [Candidatus Sulfotelmatobacter sp.]